MTYFLKKITYHRLDSLNLYDTFYHIVFQEHTKGILNLAHLQINFNLLSSNG